MKKIIQVLIVLIVLIASPSTRVEATSSSGTYGENLTWTLDENGTLTISGDGEMIGGTPASSIFSSATKVIIEEGITSIGNYAFYQCSNLTEVSIPSSVISIGDYAFYQCTGLTEVSIPSNVTSIGTFVFYECSGLREISIPFGVTCIRYCTFYRCGNLEKVSIPSSVTYIENSAFCYCRNLEEINFPSSLISIGDDAFSLCSSLTKVSIPSSVINIGTSAFSSCSSLIEINIPSSITSIGNSTFSFCSSLTEISIPSSVTNIKDSAFDSCTNLESIKILNPYCIIASSLNTIPSTAMIYGYASSTAEDYATEYGRSFSPLTESSEGMDGLDFGTVLTTYEDLCQNSLISGVPLSIEWNLNSLIDIGEENKSLALLGLLLSDDSYNGTDSVAERMIKFGLLDKQENIWEGQDLNTNSGICFYVSVKKVEKGNEHYYIVTAVSRGTRENVEWIYNILYTAQFFKARGDELYSGIKKALEANGLEMTDSRVRYFLTGHSLGGAISNYLSSKLWKNGVHKDRIACYTYASPLTCHDSDDKMSDGHIYNYIGVKDVVPTVGQSTNDNRFKWGTHRFGNDILMGYDSDFSMMYNAMYSPQKQWIQGVGPNPGYQGWGAGTTAGNLIDHYILSGIGVYHELGTYLVQILVDEAYNHNIDVTTLTVLCPVDVYVYDATGNVVASVINNTVVNAGNEDVIIAVIDDGKFITLRNEGDYTVKYIGTDTGTMSTTITKKTSTGETVKTFSNVELEKGKQMVSFVQENETSQDIRLFVLDDEEKIVSEINESGVEIGTKLPNTDAKDNTKIHILMFGFFMPLMSLGGLAMILTGERTMGLLSLGIFALLCFFYGICDQKNIRDFLSRKMLE